MGFGEKVKFAFRKIKTKLIVYTVLFFVVIFWMLAPLNVSVIDAQDNAGVSFLEDPFNETLWQTIIVEMGDGILHPVAPFGRCFTEHYRGGFTKILKPALVAYLFFATIGLVKAIPKSEYQDIENGSSDWSEGGEQYKVLSKNKGIVLAEKNYLPVDKRGNVNVLVVRRFWCW